MAAVAGKRVVTVKNEARCKICQSQHAEEIDYLLLLRSLKHPDADGEIITLELLQARVLAAYGLRLTKENVTVHFGKHRQIDLDDTPDDEDNQALALIKEFEAIVEGGVDRIDIDAALRAMFKVGFEDFIAGLRSGKTKVSLEQMLKISDALTRRQRNEAEAELLHNLGQGIGAAFGGALVQSAKPALTEGDPVIDAHPTEDGVYAAEVPTEQPSVRS